MVQNALVALESEFVANRKVHAISAPFSREHCQREEFFDAEHSFRASRLVLRTGATLPSPHLGLNTSADAGYYGEGIGTGWGNLTLRFDDKPAHMDQDDMWLPRVQGGCPSSSVLTHGTHETRHLQATADWRAYIFSPLLVTHAGWQPAARDVEFGAAFAEGEAVCSVCEPIKADVYFPSCLLDFKYSLPYQLGGRRSAKITDGGMSFATFHHICDVLVGVSKPAETAVKYLWESRVLPCMQLTEFYELCCQDNPHDLASRKRQL